jgi:Protein of unknown function (DUF3568)
MDHIWRAVWLQGALALAAAALLLAGCRTVHPHTNMGTGTYSYLSRRLAWTYPYTLDEIWAATLAGLAELNYGIETHQFDGLGGRLEAQAAVGGHLFLEARPEGQNATRLWVRVRGAGHRLESERIHEMIRSKLGVSM